MFAPLDGSDRVSPATGGFYIQASGGSVARPAAGYDDNSTGLLCWRDFHPQEWQLASLHQILRAGEIIQRQRDFVSKGTLTRRVTDIRPVLKDAVALALIDRRHRGITVVERLDPDACFVLIDRVQVQQVLVNLIRNAAEAMEGRPRQVITLATAPKEAGLVEISVADTGSGMAANLAGRLFEPFVTTKPDGMGVGLSICRTILEAHGGHIRVDAGLEGGTVVRFTLEAGGQRPPSSNAIGR